MPKDLDALLRDRDHPVPRVSPVPEMFRFALVGLILLAVGFCYRTAGKTQDLAEDIKRSQLENRQVGFKNRAIACLNNAATTKTTETRLMPQVCRDPEIDALYKLSGDEH